MRTTNFYYLSSLFLLVFSASCEILDNDINKHSGGDLPFLEVEDIARILAEIPIGSEQVGEVFDAVSSSSENGYDEEYTMRDLLSSPGAGVGDRLLSGKSSRVKSTYERPMRDLIEEYLAGKEKIPVKSSSGAAGISADKFLEALENSDIQIYWPFSEKWDRKTSPVITFDPSDGSETNVGYRVVGGSDGERKIEEVIVDERMAEKTPVWVVNRNSDAGFTSLEILRRQDPEWGSGGGTVIVRPGNASAKKSSLRTLVLKEITVKKNFDPWFSGASELFVKIGAVEDFNASTEAELQLYNPAVTDFMIVVRRDKVRVPVPFNAVLVSDWTDQLEQCAFMVTEDDGGTRTSWKCTAVVKVASKSYGIDINLPFNTRDDIIWRGQLSRRYIESNDKNVGHFGEIDLTFEIKE